CNDALLTYMKKTLISRNSIIITNTHKGSNWQERMFDYDHQLVALLPLWCPSCRRLGPFTSTWLLACLGPTHTPYAGGLFLFHLNVRRMPFAAPQVRVLTP